MRAFLSLGTDWRVKSSRVLGLVDACVLSWAVLGAFVLRFGTEPYITDGQGLAYGWGSVLLIIVWWIMLGAWNTRQSRILGSGSDEFKRVTAASLWLFGLIAIFSYVFRVDTARGYVGIALPVGLVGLFLARWLVRQHLSVQRSSGSSMYRLMLLGGPGAVSHLANSLNGSKQAGYLPVAAYTPGSASEAVVDSTSRLPVLGNSTDPNLILEAIDRCGADAVAISAGVQLHPQVLRHLGWELAARNIGLIMAPALTDIAGPRIHTQQVAGLPLIHVTTPTLEGGQRVAKRLFDIIAAALLILATSPLMIVAATSVKLDSKGPALFKQDRVGIEGKVFKMLKFRSMAVDAEQRLAELQKVNEGSGVLFKMKDDPRVTRVGRILRKFSIDELPQLFNIFSGSMSLVGQIGRAHV